VSRNSQAEILKALPDLGPGDEKRDNKAIKGTQKLGGFSKLNALFQRSSGDSIYIFTGLFKSAIFSPWQE